MAMREPNDFLND